jgi:hypothetical protein
MIGGTIFFSLGPTFILLFQKTKWKRKKATS